MYPFINIFGASFPTYGLMVLAGVGAAFGLSAILCSKSLVRGQRIDRMDTLLTCSIIILGAIVGAASLRPLMKLPEVIIRWDYFSQLPIGEVLGYVFGEIVFYGGLIGGAIASFIFCRFYKIPIISTLDAIAPAAALGHAFGRIGCFMAGCCYGMEVSSGNPFAVVYPAISLGAPSGIPLLALQAIEAGGLIIISAIVVLVYIKTRPIGLCLTLYLAIYSAFRFTLEYFRGDPARGIYGPFSTSQYISIAIFITSLVLMYIAFSRDAKESENTDKPDESA